MVKLGMILADIHFGIANSDHLYYELEEMVLNKIDELPILDFIIIAGDTLDMKVYLGSNASRLVGKFTNELIKRTERLNTEIVVIEGTASHDNRQMDAILGFIEHPRIKMHKDVTEDILCDNISVLYVPEEYVVDQEEYYKKYFDNKYYDLIIGHGMVDKMWFSKVHKNDDMVTRVPVFKVDELLTKCTNCYFGHIHTSKSYGKHDKFKYVGSFSRWKFGEEEDKGYRLVSFNTTTREFTDEFIVNYLAPVMNTLLVDIRGELELSQVLSIVDNELNQYREESDLIRLIINIDKSMSNYMAIKDLVMVTYGNMKKVKLVISIDIPEESMIEMKDTMETKRLSNEYVFDTSISIEDKISRFIRDKMNRDISPDEVRQCLNEKL